MVTETTEAEQGGYRVEVRSRLLPGGVVLWAVDRPFRLTDDETEAGSWTAGDARIVADGVESRDPDLTATVVPGALPDGAAPAAPTGPTGEYGSHA